MAKKKFTELPAATTPLTGAEIIAIVQGGVSKKATVDDLPAGGGGGAVDSVNGDTGAVVVDLQSALDQGSEATVTTDVSVTTTEGITLSSDDGGGNQMGVELSTVSLGLGNGSSGLTITPSGIAVVGNKKITGLAAASANGDSVRYEQVTNGFEPANVTGTAISFAVPQIYGSDGSPETGNITVVTTGLIKGTTQLLIHNNGTTPTFGSPIKIISGAYVTGELNYIMLLAVSTTSVLVTITQEV